MQIREVEDEYSIRIEFYIHRACVKTFYIIKAMANSPESIIREKRRIMNEAAKSSYFIGKEKEILKEWAKTEPAFRYDYENLYPRGGSRKNAGRPRGIRTLKTERINISVTPEEKVFILEALENFRSKHEK